MGLVVVKYRSTRGNNAEGEEVMNAEHYFSEIVDNFGEFKALYDQLDEAKQTEFRNIFEDDNIMLNKSMAEMWVTQNEEVLDETMEKVKEFMRVNC